MQARRFVAVWLGVCLCSACGVPAEPVDTTEDVASDEAAVAGTPVASPAGALGPLGKLAQRAYVKASNTGTLDNFGYSVALSADGSTLAVGAVGEASAATGVGDPTDETAPGAGAVYVFRRSGTTWLQQAYLKASNAGAGDHFGYSVALSADGSTLAVGAPSEDSAATGIDGDQANDGAPYSGAVYVFTRRGMKWRQTAYVKASNTGGDSDNNGYADTFGRSVALSAGGSTLAVGAPYEKSAATGIDGDQADNSAPDAGAVYVFTRHGMRWSQQAYVKASNTEVNDAFGFSVALSADGSTLAVSAELESSAATGVGGNEADNSAQYAGAVYVFARSGTAWSQQAYVKASNPGSTDLFGYQLALSGDGATLAVGAIHEDSGATGINGDQGDMIDGPGAAYVFTRCGTVWSQQAYIKASNTGEVDVFGASIALSGDGSLLAVGAPNEHSAATGIGGDQADNSAYGAGAVYVFARSGTTWSQAHYIKASNTDAHDSFGTSVALSADGSTLAVGAPSESSAATGIGGDQADDSAPGAGAVYVFDRRP